MKTGLSWLGNRFTKWKEEVSAKDLARIQDTRDNAERPIRAMGVSALPQARLTEAFESRLQITAPNGTVEKEHVVQDGDWLYGIGRKHNVDVTEILKANPSIRDPDTLPVGSCLKIPQKVVIVAAKEIQDPLQPILQLPKPMSASSSSVANPSPLIHLSDTMSASSSVMDPSPLVLQLPNPMSAPSSTTDPSPALQLPSNKTSASSSNTNSPTQLCLRNANQDNWKLVALGILLDALRSNRVHKVRPGDTLECIAMKFGTTASSLKKLNNLTADTLQPGSLLKIDKAKRVQPKAKRQPVQKATQKERVAMMDGTFIDAPQPVQAPMSENPTYKGPALRRGAKPVPKPFRLKTVTVRYGDTLADIAWEHSLTVRELQRLNNLRDDNIFEGDVLTVSEVTQEKPSSQQDLRRGSRRTARLLFSRTPSSPQPSRLGIGGPELTPRAAAKSRAKVEGVKGAPLEGRWKKKRRGLRSNGNRWLRFNSPVTDGFVSSGFGWRWGAFHEGVDLAADHGAPILASDKGVVTFAGWSGGYGYLVAIQHEGGFTTRYGHCCAIHARVGQQVQRGQQVAAVGATGHATGPHLHFEVRKNGEALDPFRWVNL